MKKENIFKKALNEGHFILNKNNLYYREDDLRALKKLNETVKRANNFIEDLESIVEINPSNSRFKDTDKLESVYGPQYSRPKPLLDRMPINYNGHNEYSINFKINDSGNFYCSIHFGEKKYSIENIFSDYLANASFILSKMLEMGFILKGENNEKLK